MFRESPFCLTVGAGRGRGGGTGGGACYYLPCLSSTEQFLGIEQVELLCTEGGDACMGCLYGLIAVFLGNQ